jgi:hypothetical protein
MCGRSGLAVLGKLTRGEMFGSLQKRTVKAVRFLLSK